MCLDMSVFSRISNWWGGCFRVWRREFKLVFSDVGVLMFFFGLPIAYPIVYTLIYNPEVVNDIPIAVVDHSRTTRSRELARMFDATQAMQVYDYVPTLADARVLMNDHKIYGILEIPADYSKKLGSGEQAVTTFYCEMNLLLRYRTILLALADLQLDLGAKIQTQKVDMIGLPAQGMNQSPVNNSAIMLGDPTQGFCSFIMPGVLMIIIQQSLVLGICMLFGGHRERLRRNGGVDPLAVDAPVGATMFGKLMCYFTIYMPLVFFMLSILPAMFSLPHIGDAWQYFSFAVPLVVASVFFGMFIGQFVRDRESTLLVVVGTTMIFLFLSGLTWPRFAMNPFWQLVGDIVPTTWAVEGYININSTGSDLFEQRTPYTMLWVLAASYGLLVYVLRRLARRRNVRGEADRV